MKRVLIFIVGLIISISIYGQSSMTSDIRVANNTTTFGINLSVGTKVWDVNARKLFVVKSPVVGTLTLATGAAYFDEITGDNSSTNEIQQLTRVADSLKLTNSLGVDLSDYAKDADFSGYVPYSGATGTVNLGLQKLNAATVNSKGAYSVFKGFGMYTGDSLRWYLHTSINSPTPTFNISRYTGTGTWVESPLLIQSDGRVVLPKQLVLNQTTGTAPLNILSTTKVTNLNVDAVDGISSEYIPYGNYTTATTAWNDTVSEISKSGFYYLTGTVPDRPNNISSMLIHSNMTSGNYALQIGARNDRYWVRTQENGIWASWKELYHSGNFAAPANVIDNGGINLTANYIPKASDANTLVNSNSSFDANGVLTINNGANNSQTYFKSDWFGTSEITGYGSIDWFSRVSNATIYATHPTLLPVRLNMGLSNVLKLTRYINNGDEVAVGTSRNMFQFDMANGAFIQQSEANYESAPISSTELLSDANWTSTDWTGTWSTGFTHTTGNTTPLSNTLAGVAGNLYQIVVTVTNRTAGYYTIDFGGDSYPTQSASITYGPRTTTTGTLSITPTTDFNGTIVISIKQITTYAAIYQLQPSSGNNTLEVRATKPSSFNSFIGYNTGRYTTTGTVNTAVGASNLSFNTTGTANTAVGYASLNFNTYGNHNTAIGYASLYNNTSGGYNTAIGYTSLYNNTSGGYNVGIGYYALYNNTTGGQNVAIGRNALSLNTTGTNNVAIGGRSTLYSNTTGNYNTALNYSSLFSNTTGSSNIGLGYQSLYSNTTGNYNTSIGYTSLYGNIDGNNNIAIGYESGRYVGASGTTANTTSDNSIYLGHQSRGSADGASNEIVIGVSAVGEGSNSVRLGNTSTTKVVTSGTYRGANAVLSNEAVMLGQLPTLTSIIDNGGISGTSGYLSKFTDGNTLANSPIYADGTNVSIGGTSPNRQFVISYVNAQGLEFRANGVNGYPDITAYNRSTSQYTPLRIDASQLQYHGGYFGINTNSPSQFLDVNGNARFRSIGTTLATSLLGVIADGTLTTNVILDTTDIVGLQEFVETHSISSYTETDPIWTSASTNYYTKTNLQTSGQASVHWDNITNEPTFLTSYTETDPVFSATFPASIPAGFIPAKTIFGGIYTQSEIRSGTNEVYINMTTGDLGNFTLQTTGTGYFTGQVYSGQNATTDSSLVRLNQVYTKTNLQTSGQASIHWDNITNEPTFLTGNQTITISGDASGSGTTAITLTVADDSHNHNGTTISGLSVADFTSPNISNWTNDANYADKDLANIFLDDQTIQGSAPYLFLRSTSVGGTSTLRFKDESDLPQFSIQYDSNNDRTLITSNNHYISTQIGALEVMNLATTGQLKLSQYTGTTFDGTITKYLGVDASGNVVKGTVSSGVTDHSALSNLSYATAGHTDFVSTNTTQTISAVKTFSANPVISANDGNLRFTGTNSASIDYYSSSVFKGGIYFQSSGRVDLYAGEPTTYSGYFNFNSEVKLPEKATPVNTNRGTLYFDTDDNTFRGYNGSSWVDLGSSGGSMVYPSAGIPVSNGSAWLTSVSGTALQVLRRNAGNTAYEFYTLPAYLTSEVDGSTGNELNISMGYTASTRTIGVTDNGGTKSVVLPLFTSTEAGLTPSSGGGTTNFLRADGTWAAPTTSSKWQQLTGAIAPVTITDEVRIGGSGDAGNYLLQVTGNTYISSSIVTGVNVQTNELTLPERASGYTSTSGYGGLYYQTDVGLMFKDENSNETKISAKDNDFTRFPMLQTDFLGPAGAGTGEASWGFDYAVIASGTQAKIASEANHPGILRTSSSTTTNSGGYCMTDNASVYISGGEVFECIFQPRVASNTNTTIRIGFMDSYTSTAPVDGCYFELAAGTLNIVGINRYGTTNTTSTAPVATLTVNTWYRLKIEVNSAASSVTYTVYNSSGTVLGTQTNTGTIPTGSTGRETGCGVIATNSGTTATLLAYWDMMSYYYNKPLVR